MTRINRIGTIICYMVIIAIAMFVSACTRDKLPETTIPPSVQTALIDRTTVLAKISEQDKPTATDMAMQNRKVFRVMFSERGGGVLYTAQRGETVRVVHNGTAGMPAGMIDQIVITPDGLHYAYSSLIDGKWRMVINGVVGVESLEVDDPVFSPNGKHIAYQVKRGSKWYMAIDDNINEGCSYYCSTPVFSGVSPIIAYIEVPKGQATHRLILSDLMFNKAKVLGSIASPIFTNWDNSRIAVISAEDNKHRVLEFGFNNPDDVQAGPLFDRISDIIYGPDGKTLAYVGEQLGSRFLFFEGREESIPDGELMGPPVIRSDNKGVGIIMSVNERWFLHEGFIKNGTTRKSYDEIEGLVYRHDGKAHAYAARKGDKWFIVVNGNEGPPFDRVVGPQFSFDNKKIVYRVRQGGERFVVVADAKGKTIKRHESFEMVFPPVFTADGKSVAYGVKDGNELIWKVEEL
ncbi:MAG: PD40 domain-containing protein [Nitrospirota bacterium]|nr:MAG: PD40 domain-containing protein [Nitrospirota bacterium]